MSDTCYTKRVDDGVYESVVEQLKALGPSTLALANLDEHFSRLVNQKGNYTYVTSDKSEFTPLVVGEICTPELGTINRAAGNHYSANGEVYPVHTVYFAFAHSAIRPSLTHPKSKMFLSSDHLALPPVLFLDSLTVRLRH
jgi:hypothetical protein